MSFEVSYPDKIFAGVNLSVTVITDEGDPSAEVRFDSTPLELRFRPLGHGKYKATFLLPEEARGKTLDFKVKAGGSESTHSGTAE